jgi:hypothetical protein
MAAVVLVHARYVSAARRVRRIHGANGKRALRENRTSDFAVCFLIALRDCRLLVDPEKN